MAVIVRTSYENAKQYKGRGIVTKIGNKNQNVFFKVIVDDFTIEDALKNNDSNIVMYDYHGMVTNPVYLGIDSKDLYITKSYEYGNDISESDILEVLNEVPEGVTPIIKLPSDYKNFEFVCKMCDKYSRIRFCGGILFCAKGCRIGCCGRDILDNAGIKYSDSNSIKEGCACALDILSDEGLELSISEKKAKSERKRSSSGTRTKKPKAKLFEGVLNTCSVDL